MHQSSHTKPHLDNLFQPTSLPGLTLEATSVTLQPPPALGSSIPAALSQLLNSPQGHIDSLLLAGHTLTSGFS